MSKLYRFPHLHRFDGLLTCKYVDKIYEEAYEVVDAFNAIKCYRRCDECDSLKVPITDGMILEIMDTIQSCETALRNSGRTEEELLVLMERHNAKDAARWYDKPREESC